MDNGPLVTEEIDAGLELARAFDRFEPVKAAFWLKASDEGERYLYLASDGITPTNLRAAYDEVGRLATQLQSPHLDLFRVKLINGNNPLALEAFDTVRRFPSPLARWVGGRSFGGLTVDDGYLYPSPLPTPG